MADDKGHGGAPQGHDEHPKGKHKHKKHGGHGHGGHHEEGVPEWMVSFADNVCLMMGFFVIMLAMNMSPPGSGNSDEGKEADAAADAGGNNSFLDMAIAIREGFNNPVNVNSSNPNDAPLVRRLRDRSGASNDRAPTGQHDRVQSIRASDFYSPCGVVPFADNSAAVALSARPTIRQIADKLKGPRFIVEVRGHASAMEAERSVERGMALSHERAMAVAQALAAEGVPWARLRVIAVSDHERVTAIAYEPKGHRSNQRVEVLVTKEIAPEDPYMREQTPADARPPAGGAAPQQPADGETGAGADEEPG